MEHQFRLESFEGPLDLILFLLSKNKIEIQNISVSLILDQYLAYLEERKRLDLEIASEFILMASHLMFIKSRMLVSVEDEEAKSEMDELIRSLQERQQKDTYMRVKSMLDVMATMSEFGRNTMTRPPEPRERGKVYDYDHEPEDLVGKKAVAILNLPARKMMGMESNGMLLSAVKEVDGKEVLNLMFVDESVPVGSQLC